MGEKSIHQEDITSLCDFNLTATYLIWYLNSSSVRCVIFIQTLRCVVNGLMILPTATRKFSKLKIILQSNWFEQPTSKEKTKPFAHAAVVIGFSNRFQQEKNITLSTGYASLVTTTTKISMDLNFRHKTQNLKFITPFNHR